MRWEMAKYLLKTMKINDDAKSGDQVVESNWMYIDSETIHIIDIFGKKFVDEKIVQCKEVIEEFLTTASTVEAEPVKHAHVITDDDGNMWCSNCGSSNCFDNYCGYCGAKIDEVKE